MWLQRAASALLVAWALATAGAPAHAQETEVLTNKEVLELVAAGVGDDILIAQIHATNGRYDLSTKAVLELSRAKVSAAVIAAMRESNDRFGKPKKQKAEFQLPTDFGVYLVTDDQAVPLGGYRVERHVPRRGDPFYAFKSPRLATAPASAEAEPTFIVFLKSAENVPSIRLASAAYIGDDSPAELEEIIPTRAGTVTGATDPRYVRITPTRPLPIGMYALTTAESQGMAYVMVKTEGEAAVTPLEEDIPGALERLRAEGSLQLPIPPAEAMDVIREVLKQEKLTVAKDFGEDSVLVTPLALKKCGLLSFCTKDVYSQLAIYARPTDTGTVVHVIAAAYHSGLPGGKIEQSLLEGTPKIRAAGEEVKLAGDFRNDVAKAVDKRLKGKK